MVFAAPKLKLRVQVQVELGKVLELRVVVPRALALTFAIQFALEIRADLVVVLVPVRLSMVLV